MFKVTSTGPDTSEIVASSRLISIGAGFFLVVGALDVVAGVVSGHPGDALGAGLASLALGGFYGFVPHRIVVKVDRTLGELTRTSRALFRSSEQTEKLAELECVAIGVGTYYWFFNAVRKNGMTLLLFSRMKMWTFTSTPPADVVARASEIASALGLPYRPTT